MIYSWFVRGQKHAALCQVSMQAVKKAESGGRSSSLQPTNTELKIPGAEMVYFASGNPLMTANLEAQPTVLDRFDGRIVFLDTDVLFLKPFPKMPGNLTVTWRDTVGGVIEDVPGGVAEMMPYNFGVVGVTSGLRTTEAFLWMRERIRRMASHLQDWWGNQLALAALCGPRSEEEISTEMRKIPWKMTQPGPEIMVCKIPGLIWNFTPNTENDDISGKGAVHFKGHTRKWMKGYAERMGLEWMEKTDD